MAEPITLDAFERAPAGPPVGSGHAFQDRGSHELRGVPDEWHLYAVVRG